MRKQFILFIALAMLIGIFAGCTSPADQTTQEEKYTIGISYQGPNNDWAINFKAHFEMTLAKYSDQIERVIYKEYGWDESQQIADVEDFLTLGIDILIIAPQSDAGLATSIENVKEAGIPVVVYNNHPGTEQFDALIMSDTVADGFYQADWLFNRLNGEGNVLFISGAPGSNYAEDLMEGYDQALDKHPDINVLGYEYAYWTPATAKEITESYIAKGDTIDGIIVGGLMGLGCMEAFIDAGLTIPPMTSGDGWTGFLRKAKEVGYTDFAAIPTNNFVYAVGAIDLAFDVLNGNEFERVTLVEPKEAMPAQEMLDMLTDDMPESYWIGGTVPVEDFAGYIN